MTDSTSHSGDSSPNNRFSLAWIRTMPMDSLDSATWLNTTQILRKDGWSVHLIAPGKDGISLFRGVPVDCVFMPNIYILRQAIYHIRVISRLNQELDTLDFILFHEMSAIWFFLFRFWCKFIGKKKPLFVLDNRTLPMAPKETANGRIKLRRLNFSIVNTLSNHFTDGRLAITNRLAESLHIPPSKYWGCWPSGVDIEFFAPAQNDRVWPQVSQPIIIIYIGSMFCERNLLTLSRAVVKSCQQGNNFQLIMIGDGDQREEIEEYSLSTNGIIQVFPPVPQSQILPYLAKAHIGSLPFPDEEKFRVSSPIKLFEYMASGLPILATRVTCHTDVIPNDKYTFWAEGSDEKSLLNCLTEIEQNRDRLPDMGAKSRLDSANWTWEKSTEKLAHSLTYGFSLHNKSDN